MAEFALGLTKTAVEGTLVRVKSAIDEEAEYKEKVQNDLVFITGEFEMMRSFLYAANASDRAKNPVVRTWVRQLRDLAFDVEDCVDFVVHLETNKSDWWWRLVPLPACIAPPLPVNVAVAQIQQLKARVEDVSKRNARYNLIGDVSMPPNQLIPVATQSSTFDVLSEVWEAAGKLRGTCNLKKLITSHGDDLQVISLWQGSCSIGAAAAHHNHHHHHLEATYIMKKAYDDADICQRFESRAWVKLMHPFDPDEFLKNLLAQFYPPNTSHHQPIALGGAEFRRKMREAIAAEDDYIKADLMQQVSEERRYLVVLEGVSTVVEWDAIRMYLPHSNNGSRIVVSTEHLRIAVLCTGEPYQVSQLTRFSDGQFLCAFSTQGSVRRSDIGEFNWQITCGGVISVVRNHSDVGLVRQVYDGIRSKHKGFNGVVAFEEHSWVDVPLLFDIKHFAIRLFLNFQSRDFDAKYIAEVGKKGHQGVLERCRKYLHEHDCLVVINGVDAPEVWNKIKTTFLLSKPGISKSNTCIIVITRHETVAKHCAVLDQQNRVFTMEALEDDEVLDRLIKQDTRIRIGVEDSALLYNQRKEAHYWHDTLEPGFNNGRDKEFSTLSKQLQHPGVISVWGPSGVGKSTLVKRFYYGEFLKRTEAVAWVDVPRSFNLTDFSWRLVLDLPSTYEDKEEMAAHLMLDLDLDLTEMCREIMGDIDLLIIDGLQSKRDWDIIKKTFLSGPHTQSGSIVVITNKESVAKYCVNDNEDRLLKVKRLHVPSDLGPFVGRGKEKSDLMYHLSNPGVISLWGIAGVGKSALVRNIYDNHMDMVCYGRQKQYKMSWVDVPHPFHLMEFSRRLLLGFYSTDLQAQETAAVGIMEGQDTVQACCKFLGQNKWLVVIDGLQSTHDWDLIKASFFSEPNRESHIIVITTKDTVATHCASEKRRVHNIKGLDDKDAIRLFTMVAGSPEGLTSEMNRVEAIMAKCGGLPQVIVAIGKYLAEELSKIEFTKTPLATILGDRSDDFMGKLETDPRFHNLKGLFSWMQSYFDACSDSLKPCIFYLSVFHSDKRIRRRRLLRRWIAEGYSRDSSDGGTAEENAEELFAELVESSIIQLQRTPSSASANKVDDGDGVWQVNGFIREYIISRPMEDNLVFVLEGRCSINSQRAGQHLAIRNSWDGDENVFKSMDLSRLRSLTVFGKWRSFFISKETNMRLLRVLDLEDADSGVTDEVLEQIGKLLPRLKFLSLRGCNEITRIPDSLRGMRQLQSLDVRNTNIATLPSSIVKLVKLQYVRAGTSHKTLDEFVDVGRPAAPDIDECTSISSEDRLSSMEEGDDTVAGLATNNDSTSTNQPPAHEDQASTTQSAARMSKARHVVASYSRGWLSTKKKKKKNAHDSVEVPAAAIGKLTALHTIGVINVSGAHGKAVLEGLQNLTQMRKLGISGVNRKNLHDLCRALSCHGHLESFSVRLEEDEDAESFLCSFDDMFSNLPKTVKSLKLSTGGRKRVQVSPTSITQLVNLRKINFDLKVSTQGDIDALVELPNKGMVRQFCVKPTQDGKLRFGLWQSDWTGERFRPAVINIDCGSYSSEIVFGPWISEYVEVLVVHCSSHESALKFSMLNFGLPGLKEVRLKGSYSDELKEHLEQQVNMYSGRKKPVLKLEN